MKWLQLGLAIILLVGPVAPQRADQPPRLPTEENAPAIQLDLRPSLATAKLPPIDVHFSPNGGCTEAVVKEMNAAKDSILVQAYSFTSAPIAKALVEAHERGVRVEVILDKSNRTKNYSAADFVQHAGIPTLIDGKHAIAHNKDHDPRRGSGHLPGASISPGRLKRKTPRTCSSSGTRRLPSNTQPTGRNTPSIRKGTKGRKLGT